MGEKLLISVVICAYNAEEFLEEALVSVLGQSYQDIEIIVVEDCSTDNTLAIAQSYAKNDSRVKIVRHEINRGLAMGRKSGAQAACGEYVLYLDADDMFDSTLCEVVAQNLHAEKTDVLQFPVEVINEASFMSYSLASVESFVAPYSGSIKGSTLIEACFLDKKFSWTIWNKAYRREVLVQALEHLEGQHLYVAEDVFIQFVVLFYACSYKGIEGKGLYRYRLGSGITSGTMHLDSFKKFNRQADVVEMVRQFLIEQACFDDHEPAFNQVHKELAESSVSAFWELGAQEQHEALEILLKTWGPVATLSSLEFTVADRHAEIAHAGSQLHRGSQGDRPVKTIATHYYRFYNGGTEAVMSQLAFIWAALGYDVVIITDEDADARDYPLPKGARRRHIGKYQWHDYSQRAQALVNVMQEENIDVFVSQSWISRSALWDNLTVKTLGIPVINYIHSTVFSMQFISEEEFYQEVPQFYQLFDANLTLSRVDRLFWQQFNKNTVLTVNPILLPDAGDEFTSSECTDLLWVGRLEEMKGYKILVPLVKELCLEFPQIKLTIVGSKEWGCDIEQEIKKEGLQDNIILAGFKDNVAPYYDQAKLFVMTSYMEGFPLTLYESKAAGLPCVAFDLPYVEMFRDNEGMRIVPMDDLEEMVMQIKNLLNDDEERMQLAKEARRSIAKYAEFDHGKQWSQLIKSVTSGDKQEPLVSFADEVLGDRTKQEKQETLRILISQQHRYSGYASKKKYLRYQKELEESSLKGKVRKRALASDSIVVKGLLKLRRRLVGTSNS